MKTAISFYGCLLVVVAANVVLYVLHETDLKLLRAEQAKSARYEHYLTCIIHGQGFTMEQQDGWLMEPGAHNVTIQPTAGPERRKL
jgi:hypothetical protein